MCLFSTRSVTISCTASCSAEDINYRPYRSSRLWLCRRRECQVEDSWLLPSRSNSRRCRGNKSDPQILTVATSSDDSNQADTSSNLPSHLPYPLSSMPSTLTMTPPSSLSVATFTDPESQSGRTLKCRANAVQHAQRGKRRKARKEEDMNMQENR